MAYIPDDAIDDCTSISSSAFRLYCLICRRRNHKFGNSLLDKTTAGRLLDISRPQIFRAFKELKDKQWISSKGASIEPIYGSFSPVSKYQDILSQKRDSESQFRDESSQKRDRHYSSSLKPAFKSASNGRRSVGCKQCSDIGLTFGLNEEWVSCPQCAEGDQCASDPRIFKARLEDLIL